MNRWLYGCWLLLLYFLCPAAWGQPLLLADENREDIFPAVEVLEDPSGKLSVAEVMSANYQQQFKAIGNHQQSLGYTNSAWWVSFDVIKTGHTNWWLMLDTRNDIKVDVYIHPLSVGAEVSKLPRESGFLRPAYMPVLDNLQPYRFYVRLSNYYTPLAFHLSFNPAEQVMKDTQTRLLVLMLALGGVLSLAAYNLFLYFNFREESYLQLVVFIVALCTEMAATNGILYLLIKSEVLYKLLLPLPSLLAIVSSLGFFRGLIRSRQSVPFLDKLIVAFIRVTLFVIIFSPYLPVTSAWGSFLGLLILPLAFSATLLAIYQGYKIARSFMYALLVLTIGILPSILMGLGILPVMFYGTYMLHAGMLGFVLLLSQTQVEHTRSLRAESERAQAASQAKTDFLATMSHELRTPMNAVVGIGSLLRKTPLNTEQRDYLDKLEVSSRHMLRLIDDILDFSRIEQRGPEIAHEPFQLKPVLRDISGILQDQARHKGLSFVCDMQLDNDAWLLGDATRLSQVLLNLVGNAIKFTNVGQVRLFIQQLEDKRPNSLTVEFEVSDTGAGLSEEQLRKLFLPFVRGENEKRKQHDGFGLGLVISQQLVQAMGGDLRVKSKLGYGSRFYFVLSFVRKGADAGQCDQEPAWTLAAPAEQKHILLVDDDEINLFVARHFLEAQQWRVTQAVNGKQAVDSFSRHKKQGFDLVLMDISMPVMDGYEATRRIRELGYQLPIVALTAHAITGERERCAAAGMDDFFTKPYELHELEQMVRKWTE